MRAHLQSCTMRKEHKMEGAKGLDLLETGQDISRSCELYIHPMLPSPHQLGATLPSVLVLDQAIIFSPSKRRYQMRSNR